MPDGYHDNVSYLYELNVGEKTYKGSFIHIDYEGESRTNAEADYSMLAQDGVVFIPDYYYDEGVSEYYLSFYMEGVEEGETFTAEVSMYLYALD